MKANRRFIRDADDGASVIVGAVLLFALSFLVLVMIQSNFVPVWQQDAEAAHSQAVLSQLTFLKSQMERQIQSAVSAPASSPIDLDRSQESQIFKGSAVPRGTLGLGEPGGSSFNLSSPELSVTTVTDPAFVGVGEDWKEVDGDVIEDVSRVASLRVRFAADAKPFVGEWAYLTVTDRNGDFAGRMGINLLKMSTNGAGINTAEFWVETINSDNDQISSQFFEANNQQVPAGSEPQYAWVNALNPDYRFERILGSAGTPLKITLTTTGGMPAEFSAAYFQATEGGGEVLVGGGGETITDYEEVTTGTSLTYESLSQYYVQQDFIMEHGAILLAQGSGATVASAPAMAVGSSTNLTAMTWTVPFLDPATDGFTSGNSGLITTTASGHEFLTGTAPELTITLDTQYPGAWTTFWRNSFEDAGLTEGTEFSVSSTSDSASLTITGPTTGSTHDVSIAMQTATVEVLL